MPSISVPTQPLHVAVILAGSGHLDGAEIRESIITLLALDRAHAKVSIFAPNIKQHHVINHLDGTEMAESRSVLIEAARIARGDIKPLETLSVDDFSALILPGGFGVAKNYSTLAFDGEKATILPDIKHIIRTFHQQQKPIGAICIAPALIALCLRDVTPPVTVTLGEANSLLDDLGAKQQIVKSTDICIDPIHRIVSCSAYMRNDRLRDIATGIESLVDAVLSFSC
jgi:enhancing lycopene biosynthesis protein 2